MVKKMVKKKTPDCMDEHFEQVEFFNFLKLLAIDHPEAGLAYAIPNGGHRAMSVAVALKEEGVKSGVPDICWPVAKFPHHGLYIEMKRVKGGVVRAEQRKWINRLREQGYCVEVCRGAEAAIKVFREYSGFPKRKLEMVYKSGQEETGRDVT